MLCGVLAGRVTGMRCRPAVSRVVTALIWILLFMLGVEVGADRRITGNVLALGLDALAVAAGSVVGVCAVLVGDVAYGARRRKR